MITPGRDGIYSDEEPAVPAGYLGGLVVPTVLRGYILYALVLEAVWPITQGQLQGAIAAAGHGHFTLESWLAGVAEALPHSFDPETGPVFGICEVYGVGASDEAFCRQVAGYANHCIAAAQLLARIAAPELEEIVALALGNPSVMAIEVPVPLQYALKRYEGQPVHATRVLRMLTEFLPPCGAAAIHLGLQALERK